MVNNNIIARKTKYKMLILYLDCLKFLCESKISVRIEELGMLIKIPSINMSNNFDGTNKWEASVNKKVNNKDKPFSWCQ